MKIIQVSRYLGLDTWILILSNYPMLGYMDSWISHFFMYPDTWINGYLDSWIPKYFNFFSIRIMDSQNCLDIQVSWYLNIRIPHSYNYLYNNLFSFFFQNNLRTETTKQQKSVVLFKGNWRNNVTIYSDPKQPVLAQLRGH